MTPARFGWLMGRLRRFYLYNPWAVDRWLEELSVEADDEQWAKAEKVLPGSLL